MIKKKHYLTERLRAAIWKTCPCIKDILECFLNAETADKEAARPTPLVLWAVQDRHRKRSA